MSTDDLTLEKLTDTVGAAVHGVDRERLRHDDDLPAWTLDALEANGALVFPGLHLDDEAQVRFSRKLGTVEVFGQGEWPEIFVVTMDPERSKSAAYLKATVHWHIDGCTDDIPIMATMLSAHAVAETGGETAPAPTPTSSKKRKPPRKKTSGGGDSGGGKKPAPDSKKKRDAVDPFG